MSSSPNATQEATGDLSDETNVAEQAASAAPSERDDLESESGSVPTSTDHTHTVHEPGTADDPAHDARPSPTEALPSETDQKNTVEPDCAGVSVGVSSEPIMPDSNDHSEPVSERTVPDYPTDQSTENSVEVVPEPVSEPPKAGSSVIPEVLDDMVATTTKSVGGATAAAPPPPHRSLYKMKSVRWREAGSVPIVTQNENGPCPLIAIINVLLLKGKANPFAGKTELSADDLVGFLGDCILQSAPKNISEGAKLNYEQNMQDAFSIFHKLQTGLDVNVKFTGVCDFEYTPECIVFDLLNIPLYHGWLVDPQADDVVQAVGKLSYNQLVEKIITNKVSPNLDFVTEALIAENFLERSASQLTYHGLYEINAIMKSDELGVLFRNNHFSTIFKHKDELFQLVTDQGFLPESNVIWETLSNIEGDGLFVDSNFVTVPPKHVPIATGTIAMAANSNLSEEEQIQQDFLVALSIQEEQKKEEEKAMVWQEYKEKELGATPGISDEELAWRLHTEEQKALAAQQPPQEGARSGGASGAGTRQQSTDSEGRREPPPKKKSDCTIL